MLSTRPDSSGLKLADAGVSGSQVIELGAGGTAGCVINVRQFHGAATGLPLRDTAFRSAQRGPSKVCAA